MGYGRAMDTCGRCMKLSLIIVNVISFLGGLAALALGVWVLLDRSFANQLLGTNMFEPSVYVIIITGASMTILSFLGCLGAAKEVKCMLLTYYILMFIIFVTMLVGGILVIVFRERIKSTMERELFTSQRYYGNERDYTEAWDNTQEQLQCCGVKNFHDWDVRIPESCCREAYPGKKLSCMQSPDPTTIFMDGCLDKTIEYFRSSAICLGIVAIIVACIMILGLICSCALFVKIE